MANLKFNPEQKTDNFVIEEAIIGKLRAGEAVEVAADDLDEHYQSVDDTNGGDESDESLTEKCDEICTNLAKLVRSPVEYSNQGEIIEFRMVTARPK